MTDNHRLKALKYDQTIRMLEEMIDSEITYAKERAQSVSSSLDSSASAPYAHCSTGDLNNRAIRLGVLSDILNAMKR